MTNLMCSSPHPPGFGVGGGGVGGGGVGGGGVGGGGVGGGVHDVGGGGGGAQNPAWLRLSEVAHC